jgi:hypothetical protein
MKKIFFLLILTTSIKCLAQKDSSFVNRIKPDTSKLNLNMDALYTRPFLQIGKLPLSLGGYVEANSSYFGTNGIREGLSFQLPRLTLFMSSTIKKRIKFLSEIEFEEGGRKISIEFASMDIELLPLLNLRGGIVMNPIGAFNQNHDGPKWEFISRPISATTIIPSTWNTVGFGVFGKYRRNNLTWAYELYFTNGFDDKIIANTENRTWLPASKQNTERFEKSFNGVPLITAKTAVRYKKFGELGISWMGGVYNKFEVDGLVIDKRRRIDLLAIDFNTTLPKIKTNVNIEWVWAIVDVPKTYSQQFGSKLQGGFLDIVQPVIRRKILGWENSVVNLVFRTEYTDYNVSNFNETGENIYDHLIAIVPGISFRPSSQTVIRANYRYHWQRDILGNPPALTAGFQFGFSTYF